ncbi:amidase [Sorangium cellulosum]|uniref:Amidase n=1 Tax=Sorangium cellulosum TaxID=56 RepID=A0A2L0F051_SORCE|nr:amidase [Sorangium cellulosum]AUX44947.1 amidase [Sorangium cellulosum]
MPYDLKTAAAPRLAGRALQALAAALDNPAAGALLLQKLHRDVGVLAMRRAELPEPPSVCPVLPRPSSMFATEAAAIDLQAIAAGAPPANGFAFETAADITRAYTSGRTTPEEVAERAIEAMERADRSDPPLRAFIASRAGEIRAQARASGERRRAGAALGPLDGVPVAIKDEIDVAGYPTTAGTRFLRAVAREDATVVARLRAAGAVILGKTNMHEIGIDTTGFNPHHGTPRNPYAPGHYPGGSSSGSAAAVAAGICPVALGADGGGSIRIPAALCGVAGLKPTWSRVSEHGVAPLCYSVGHVGPIGASVRDVALAYAAIAGPDLRDPGSLLQPPPSLARLGDADLTGVRLGVYTAWMDDASPAVAAACRAAVAALAARGGEVVEVEVPELDRARVAHAVTILSEMASFAEPHDAEHRRSYGLGVRVNLAIGRSLTSRDYVAAQKVRTRALASFRRIFQRIDALVTPACATTAPAIAGDVMPSGESDLEVTSALMRYAFPANLTGYPAISVPAGYDPRALPIGVQLMGRPWEEGLLLRLAEVVERGVTRRRPEMVFNLLPRG